MLIHIKSMQLEVFRRAIEVNQDDLNALVEERSSLLTQADIKHASKSLPTLPIETIAQIFSYLYWMEHLVSLSDNKTTLQRLLNDSGTTVNWRNVIQSQIPIQVSIVGAGAQFMDERRLKSCRTPSEDIVNAPIGWPLGGPSKKAINSNICYPRWNGQT